MPEHDEIAESVRKSLKNNLGSAFAAKATNSLCLALAPQPAVSGGPLGMAEGEGGPGAQPIILELESDQLIAETRARWARINATLSGRVGGAMPEAVSDEDRRRVNENLRKTMRASAVDDLRQRFDAMSKTVRERLEEDAGSQAAPEGAEAAQPFVRICWLNGTASTADFTPALAEIAASDDIRALDAPRRLVREVDATAAIIGGPAFRQTHEVGGSGVIVAVIDSEVDLTHPRFASRVTRQHNYTSEAWGAPGKHGTAVAGIVHEMAPDATIWNYKIFAQQWWMDANDFGGSLAIQQALEDGAHVANCSWGSGPAGDGTSRESRACDTAWGLGLIVVKSAGNKGPNPGTLTAPADAEGIIVVGAIDRDGANLGGYSSRGPTGHGLERPHLIAPGGLRGVGLGIRSTQPGGLFEDAGHGTSYAAPHVSGAIALLLEASPELDPDAVRDHLIACCTPLGDAALSANDQGAGLLDLMAVDPPAPPEPPAPA